MRVVNTNKAIRARLHELTRTGELMDDYDRAVLLLMSDFDLLVDALRFYARHDHWMGVTEDAHAHTLLVATKGDLPMDGWSAAAKVLKTVEAA